LSASITVFDGARSIGGNKIYLEFDDHSLFFDFGINYRKMERFYEEFLSPRSTRGIHDLLFLSIIPNVSCYRRDLVPRDVSLSSSLNLKPDAVFLSHAHMDHVGNAGLLDMNIPVVASPMSTAILKAMRDCGADMESEVAYAAPREKLREDARLIKATDWRKGPYLGRKFLVAGECKSELKDFWSTSPNNRKLQSKELKPAEDSLDFEFQAFELDHSIYGATGYAINTSSGWIVYTGDLRMHGKFKIKTERFVREARSLVPKILIIEGTRTARQDREESEIDVYKTCLEASSEEKGLIIADFSPRNFERLDTFMEIAEKAGRQLVVLTKDAYLLDAIKCVDCKDRMGDLLIYRDLKARRDAFEENVHVKFADRLLDPSDIAKEPENYILCFSFWDMKHLLDIKPENGTYIYSSSEAYNEDQVIDFLRLWNWMQFFNFKVRGFKIVSRDGKAQPEFEKGYHASGHASASELLKIVREINPETVQPVHTENPGFFEENLKEYRVLLAEEGKRIGIG